MRPADGGGEVVLQTRDDVPVSQRVYQQNSVRENIARLRREGTVPPSTAGIKRGSTHLVTPPLQAYAPYAGAGFFSLLNYVDLSSASGVLLDWNCGARTYDGHQGIDYVLWPFSWRTMDLQIVAAIGAADGVLVYKQDGYADRSCPGNFGPDWNVVYVFHPASGATSVYGHLKNGSVTSKAVGDPVVRGGYLGYIGSSGYSTEPHLHFEYIDDNMNHHNDPHAGSCRSGNSQWINQRPYRHPRLNLTMTHDVPPEFNAGCPNPGNEPCMTRVSSMSDRACTPRST